jgi:hypothetical protein
VAAVQCIISAFRDEDGNCSVCRSVGKPTTFDAAYS